MPASRPAKQRLQLRAPAIVANSGRVRRHGGLFSMPYSRLFRALRNEQPDVALVVARTLMDSVEALNNEIGEICLAELASL